MASERQRAANRRNGAKGGPKTPAGKQRTRINSIKHGLCSSSLVVLPEEHEHEYQEVLRGFRTSFQPCDPAEDALVLRLAQAHWRSLRSRSVETGILNISAAAQRAEARRIVEDCPEHLNPHNAIAVGFMVMPAERWAMYLRYDTTISRDFFRTLDALQKLQRARQPKASQHIPASQAPGAQLAMAAGAGPLLSDSGIRSVSQNTAVAPHPTGRKEATRAPNGDESVKHGLSRRTLPVARRIPRLLQHTPGRGGRSHRNLRRTYASLGLTAGYATRATEQRQWL
jgi:hypothetical protein